MSVLCKTGHQVISIDHQVGAAARLFACETFAQEPIHHQLSLNLKLGSGGVHDCAGPPSLPARNPAENFGRDWQVVDVAVDRGAIRHDLFPKQVEYTEGPDQRCYRPAVLTIGSKDIVLEYTVPKARCDDPKEAREPLRRERFMRAPPDALWRAPSAASRLLSATDVRPVDAHADARRPADDRAAHDGSPCRSACNAGNTHRG
jgi:hypothetical protein